MPFLAAAAPAAAGAAAAIPAFAAPAAAGLGGALGAGALGAGLGAGAAALPFAELAALPAIEAAVAPELLAAAGPEMLGAAAPIEMLPTALPETVAPMDLAQMLQTPMDPGGLTQMPMDPGSVGQFAQPGLAQQQMLPSDLMFEEPFENFMFEEPYATQGFQPGVAQNTNIAALNPNQPFQPGLARPGTVSMPNAQISQLASGGPLQPSQPIIEASVPPPEAYGPESFQTAGLTPENAGYGPGYGQTQVAQAAQPPWTGAEPSLHTPPHLSQAPPAQPPGGNALTQVAQAPNAASFDAPVGKAGQSQLSQMLENAGKVGKVGGNIMQAYSQGQQRTAAAAANQGPAIPPSPPKPVTLASMLGDMNKKPRRSRQFVPVNDIFNNPTA